MATEPGPAEPPGQADPSRPSGSARLQPEPGAPDLAVQRLAAVGLRVLAVAGVLGGLAGSVLFWILAVRTPGPGHWLRDALAAGIVLQVLFLATLAASAVLTWRRADRVAALRPPDYPVITCVAACIRLLGELAAVALLATSLGLAVATLAGQPMLAGTVAGWFGGEAVLPAWALPAAAAMAALLWPLAGLAAAGGTLFAAYLAAEIMTVMLDYVRDVRRIREAVEAGPEREPGSSRKRN